MKISIVIREFTTKDGTRKFTKASSKGKYLSGVNKLKPEIDNETNFDVRFTQGSIALPIKEGVYDIECESAWVDTRETVAYPTVRCKNVTKAEFKCGFKK